MRIAVVQHVDAGYYADYISSLLDEAGTAHNHQVTIWSNSIPAFRQHISDNAIVYILIEIHSAFTLKWWYALRLKSILKKLKPAVVLDLNGISISSKIKKGLILDQTLFNKNIQLSNAINKLAFKNFKHALNKANFTITYAQQNEKALNIKDKANSKMYVTHFTAPGNFRKFEWHEKIMIKAVHADNNEYFLSVLNDDAENDFMLLLRGFSIFKKWQQSSMKLLLLPKYAAFDENIHEKLKTYKYHDEVRLIEKLDETELVSMFASAHALLHFSSGLADLMTLSIALKCALPVITFKDAEVEEYMGNAAFYTPDRSYKALGDTLINLYKDENLQAQLREAAEQQSLNFDREDYKSELWQLLATAAHS